jgi:hypothetical protein
MLSQAIPPRQAVAATNGSADIECHVVRRSRLPLELYFCFVDSVIVFGWVVAEESEEYVSDDGSHEYGTSIVRRIEQVCTEARIYCWRAATAD